MLFTPHLLLALADAPQSPTQGTLRFGMCMVPAQPHVCACNPASSALELLYHLNLVSDELPELTHTCERFFLACWPRFTDVFAAEWQELPHLGTHRIDESLGGRLLTIDARKGGCKAESRWFRTDHTCTSSAWSITAVG
jgi:hypothetical protein